MGISLLDLVTEHQSGEENTLRKVVEHAGEDLDVSEASKPVELEDRIYLWERKEDLREDMPEGTYVIIDSMYFSTTVIELFEKGLESLKVRRTSEEVKAVEGVDVKIGEGRRIEKTGKGIEMINSPSFIFENYSGQRTAAMMSNNGAKAALQIIEGTKESEVYIGSMTNARALAEKLRKTEGNIHLISAGNDGVHRAEDHIAAYLITQEIHDDLDESEQKMLRKMIDITGKLHYDGDIPDRRSRDIEILKRINERESVPEYSREKECFIVQQ